MKKLLILAAVATVGLMSVSTTANAFSTKKCAACHAVDHDKIGPAWQKVVKAYGDEGTLAKTFAAGFTDRKVAASEAKWKSKEGLMTSQYEHLIKGHEKEAAHALFETVKNNKFGDY
jgi:cytochrome c551/c552